MCFCVFLVCFGGVFEIFFVFLESVPGRRCARSPSVPPLPLCVLPLANSMAIQCKSMEFNGNSMGNTPRVFLSISCVFLCVSGVFWWCFWCFWGSVPPLRICSPAADLFPRCGSVPPLRIWFPAADLPGASRRSNANHWNSMAIQWEILLVCC